MCGCAQDIPVDQTNNQKLPLWTKTHPCSSGQGREEQAGQGIYCVKETNSSSLLEASLQSFKDFLHLLWLGIQADRPLPQCAIHLGGLCRYPRPH